MQVANTLPDVNSDEFLAQLDSDTRAYLQILLNAGGTAFDDQATGADQRYQQTAEQDLREVFKRFEPTARDGKKITAGLVAAPQEHPARDPQLPDLLDRARAPRQAARGARGLRERELRGLCVRGVSLREAIRLFPGALDQTEQTLTKTGALAAELGPALERLRPFARNLAPALRKTQPFFNETTPIIRDQIRPFARDVQPTVRDLRAATNDLAVVTPRLARSFGVLNRFFNELAYDPPGAAKPFLFWASWGAHAGATMFNLQDANGPLRRGIVLVSCNGYDVLEQVILGNPQLGLLTRLLNLPPEQEACPTHPPDQNSCRDQADPQLRSYLRDGRVRPLVLRHPGLPVAELRWLGAAPAEGLPRDGRLPGGHAARPGGRREDLGRARRPREEEEGKPADRAHRHRDRDRRALRADPEGHPRDPAAEDAAGRDLRGAVARDRAVGPKR